MIIENLDCLKSWLIQTLTPICDADPETLSKYVIALVKKEKPHDELKEVCFRELEVFLQKKTKAFVSKLFDALHSNSYLTEHEAGGKETTLKDPMQGVPRPPPNETPRAEQGASEGSYKPNQIYKPNPPHADRRDPTDYAAGQDGSLQTARLMPRDRLAVQPVQESRGGPGFHRLADVRKRPAAYPPRSPRGFRPDVLSGGLEQRGRIEAYDPLPLNDVRNHRPRPSSLNRRAENVGRRDLPLPAPPKNSVQGYRYQHERLRRFIPDEKVAGSNRSARDSSPLRSLESDRADERYHMSQQQQHHHQQQQQQQPLWVQHHRDLKRPDMHERFNQPLRLHRSPFSHSRSRTRSRTASRTPSRSVDRVIATRSSQSRSQSAGRSRSRSASRPRKSSRSRSPQADVASERKATLDQEVVDSRSSTPLEEEEYKASEPLLKGKYDAVRPLTRPRCRDYDDKGFCIRGDLCEFDHGTDPVVLKSEGYPSCSRSVNCSALEVFRSVPAGLGPSLLPQGPPPLMSTLPHMSRPMSQMPYPDPQSMLPPPLMFPASEGGASFLPPPPHLMSSVPHMRDFQLYPPPSAPPHLRPFQMMPPPFVNTRPMMTLRPDPVRSMAELYQPMMMSVEQYLPEPYTPKSTGYPATPKPDEKWEASVDADPGFVASRLGPVQISANRHTNLVRVPTAEVGASSADGKPEMSAAPKRAGMKRSADVLEVQSNSVATTTGNSVQPPPLKKTAFEHPGVRHGGANNTTLELRKIPREQNTIASINDHFSKFGIIVNLQVGWEGDPQSALVSFASNAQAQLAYRSQEPFLNNRFVKIFWHNAEKPSQNPSQTSSVATTEAPRQRIVIPERHKLQLNNTLKNAAQAAKNAENAAQVAKNAENAANQTTVKNANALVKNALNDSKANTETEATVAPPVEGVASAPAPAPPIAGKLVPEASPAGNTKLQRRTSREIANKEVLVKQLELQKKTQELLQKQIEQQKILLQKLEKDKTTLSADEKAIIIETIKKLAKTIEELKTRCATIKPSSANKTVSIGNKTTLAPVAHPSLPGAMGSGAMRKVNNIVRSLSNSGKTPAGLTSPPPLSKTPVFQGSQQTQKAILDTELDLMNRQKEGTDTSELRRRVMALKEEAASLGLLGPKPGAVPKPGPVYGRGRGAMLGHGRSVGVGARRWPGGASHTVDRRPRQLLITGFLAEEKDELIAHLQEFGELDIGSCDASDPSLSVTFKLRQNAEKAASEGCNFNGKKLKMMWQKPGSALMERNSAANADPSVDKRDGAKPHAEVVDDVSKTKASAANSSSNEGGHEDGIGPDLKSEVRVRESKPGAVEKGVRLDSVTGEEDEADEDILLGLDEEDDDDNNEGGRPWRR